jgi:hypothetical protein
MSEGRFLVPVDRAREILYWISLELGLGCPTMLVFEFHSSNTT